MVDASLQNSMRFHLVSYQSELGSIQLHPSDDRTLKAKVSVIIGPNGSGKSRILADIVDELVYIAELRADLQEKKPSRSARNRPDQAILNYSLDNKLCSIERNNRVVEARVDGRPIALKEVPFPRKVFAVAHLPVDRFLYSPNDEPSFYSYLGLRQSSNLTTTGALETKVIKSLLNGYPKGRFQSQLNAWLELLGLEGPPRVSFSVNPKLLYADEQEFISLANGMYARTRYGRGSNLPLSVEEKLYYFLDKSIAFFRAFQRLSNVGPERRPVVSIPLHSQLTSADLSLLSEGLEAARALRLITDLSLHFEKSGRDILFTDLSSGEQQILGTTTRLLAELEAGSLVVIDEPEVSLHPQWQMRYIPTLLGTLIDNPGTHVLIATHSHFLVSDVDSNRSTLIVATPGTPPTFAEFEGDVHGRSPENILYRVFGISAAGNFYVQRDLAVALRMISGTQPAERDRLVEIQGRLRRIASEGEDPLQKVLAEISQFLNRSNYEKA
jgi:ABC-type lipoprotein export system ATPase subunit